jgi:hypothetical protein
MDFLFLWYLGTLFLKALNLMMLLVMSLKLNFYGFQ